MMQTRVELLPSVPDMSSLPEPCKYAELDLLQIGCQTQRLAVIRACPFVQILACLNLQHWVAIS